MPRRFITAAAAVVAALVGSLVGSYVASSATRDVVRQQTAQEALRVDAESRGAARILTAELYTAAKEMKDLGLERYFRPFNDQYRIDIAQPDLRLIASRLSSDEWISVTLALDTVVGLERYVAIRSQPSHPMSKRPLPRHTLALIRSDMEFLGRAVSSLRGLAELEDEGFPTLYGR